MALDKRSQVSLTFGTNIKPISHKVKHFSKVNYYDFGLNSYRKLINIFIICANLVETTSPMLHTKSQGHWPFVPENKILKGIYCIWVWWP